MKILVVSQYYKPEPLRVADLCEGLAAMGHQVTVVTGMPNYPEGKIYPGYEGGKRADETLDGVRVHRCPIHPRKRGAFHRAWNYYSFVFSSRRYLAGLREEFDLVFVYQLSPVMMAEGALAWARRHGKPCVLYCLDLWPESLTVGGVRAGSLLYRYYLGVSRRVYRRADRVLLSSRGFARYFQEVLGIGPETLRELPQYAETLFDGVSAVQAHEPPYRFLFAGNIGAAQSVDTILAAAEKLKEDPRVRFDIVGDGSELARCRKRAEVLSNVTFHGRRDVKEMPAFYEKADATLVTLKNDPAISYTLPGKVQSYMAAGRAVVGAVNGAAAEEIRAADCGLCAGAEDADGLAEALRKLADRPEEFVRFGENARRHYRETFTREIFFEKLTGLLEEAVRDGRAAAGSHGDE